MNALRKYLASHKGTVSSMIGAVVTSAAAAAYAGLQNGKLDVKTIACAGAAGLFGLLAGFGKSPSTPKQDPLSGGTNTNA